MSWTPLEPVVFLNELQISFLPKKIRLKKCENYAPFPFKISCYTTGYYTNV